MARKAITTIEQMQTEFDTPVFFDESYKTVLARYKYYQDRNADKMEAMIKAHPDHLSPYMAYLAERALALSGHKILDRLHKVGLIDEAMEHDLEDHYAPT
jgi:hypothetical protein